MKFQPMRLVDVDLLAQLISNGGPTQAIDYYAVDVWGIKQNKWAEMTDREVQTVRNSLLRARNNFEEVEND